MVTTSSAPEAPQPAYPELCQPIQFGNCQFGNCRIKNRIVPAPMKGRTNLGNMGFVNDPALAVLRRSCTWRTGLLLSESVLRTARGLAVRCSINPNLGTARFMPEYVSGSTERGSSAFPRSRSPRSRRSART